MDKNTLSHTTWECKYHVVFAPKYRRQVIYGRIKTDLGKILRELCDRKGIEIMEAELCPDHVHMLIRIPPKYSVSEVMGYLKGKSSLLIFDRYANLKYKYGEPSFLVQGILCGYSRKEYEEDTGIHQKPATRGCYGRPANTARVRRPVYGSASKERQVKQPP